MYCGWNKILKIVWDKDINTNIQLNLGYIFPNKNHKNQHSGMDIRDFEGIYKYKLILPAMYIVSWISMFLGPSLFPVVYQAFCFGFLAWMALRLVMFGFINFVLLVGNCRVLSRVKNQKSSDYLHIKEQGE